MSRTRDGRWSRPTAPMTSSCACAATRCCLLSAAPRCEHASHQAWRRNGMPHGRLAPAPAACAKMTRLLAGCAHRDARACLQQRWHLPPALAAEDGQVACRGLTSLLHYCHADRFELEEVFNGDTVSCGLKQAVESGWTSDRPAIICMHVMTSDKSARLALRATTCYLCQAARHARREARGARPLD